MTKRKETPNVPPESEAVETEQPSSTEPTPPAPATPAAETTPNPREEARRRSKEDLARKRRGLHKRGNF